MTKRTLTIFIILLIALAVGIGGFLYFNQTPETDNPQEENLPATSLLTVINNNVQVKENANAELKDVEGQSMEVGEGAYIKTSLTGRAVVESEDKTTTVIDKNSEFTILESGEGSSRFLLSVGSLWARVSQVFGQGEGYQIETANAVATVRGTSFGVKYKDNLTVVMVAEGIVALISIDPITKKPIGNEIIIKAGEKGSVADGYPPILQTFSAEDKRGEWYLFNNQSDVKTPPATSAPVIPVPKKVPDKPVACTQEAMLCPDGSYVSRTGPNCEFAACPQPPQELPANEDNENQVQPSIEPYSQRQY